MLNNTFDVFCWLIAGHFLCDYTFQSDFVAKYKSRHNSLDAIPWYYVLFSHASTHGAAAALITQDWTIGICETVAHFLIDWMKCEGLSNIHIDQFLHVLCKVFWLFIWLIMRSCC